MKATIKSPDFAQIETYHLSVNLRSFRVVSTSAKHNDFSRFSYSPDILSENQSLVHAQLRDTVHVSQLAVNFDKLLDIA